eukprot:jgi/Mesen1/9312/ME000060S08747
MPPKLQRPSLLRQLLQPSSGVLGHLSTPPLLGRPCASQSFPLPSHPHPHPHPRPCPRPRPNFRPGFQPHFYSPLWPYGHQACNPRPQSAVPVLSRRALSFASEAPPKLRQVAGLLSWRSLGNTGSATSGAGVLPCQQGVHIHAPGLSAWGPLRHSHGGRGDAAAVDVGLGLTSESTLRAESNVSAEKQSSAGVSSFWEQVRALVQGGRWQDLAAAAKHAASSARTRGSGAWMCARDAHMWRLVMTSVARAGDRDAAVRILAGLLIAPGLACSPAGAASCPLSDPSARALLDSFLCEWTRTQPHRLEEGWLTAMEAKEKLGVAPGPSAYNLYVAALLRRGQARKGATWHLAGDATRGFAEEQRVVNGAMALLAELPVSGERPHRHAFFLLLHHFYDACALEGLGRAQQLLDEMMAEGVPCRLPTYSALLRAYCKSGNMGAALALLARMQANDVAPDCATFTILIHGCAVARDLPLGLQLLANMQTHGIKPTPRLWAAIVALRVKCDDLDAALQMVEDLENQGLQLDGQVVSSLVVGLGRQKRADEALALFTRFCQRGGHPQPHATHSILSGLGERGETERMIELYHATKGLGANTAKGAAATTATSAAKLATDTTLVSTSDSSSSINNSSRGSSSGGGASRCEEVEKGRKEEEEEEEVQQQQQQRRRLLWGRWREQESVRAQTVVRLCMRARRLDQALAFLSGIKADGVVNVATLFDRLLLDIAQGGQADPRGASWLCVCHGFQVIRHMRQVGVSPSRLGLECLLDACAATADVPGALAIVREMEAESLTPNIFTRFRLFQVALAANDADLAISTLRHMALTDVRDADIRVMLLRSMKPYYLAAAQSATSDSAPETLPAVRRALDDVLASVGRDRAIGGGMLCTRPHGGPSSSAKDFAKQFRLEARLVVRESITCTSWHRLHIGKPASTSAAPIGEF